MRLTERTDIAVKLLTYLALLKGERVSVDFLVDGYLGHRSQVVAAVQELRKAGMIASVPGRNGGIWLDRDPSNIRLAEVVRMFESDFNLTKCDTNPEDCPLQAVCKFRTVLQKSLEGFFAPLEETTISDLVVDADREKTLALTLAS